MRERDFTRERFDAGDALRGACALGVFAVHAFVWTLVLPKSGALVPGYLGDNFRLQFGPLGYLLVMAQYGVWVFLTLSGYLISRPFVRAYLRGTPMPPMRGYFRARVLRIAPAFWVAVLATLVLLGPSGTSLRGILAVFGFVGVYYPSNFFTTISQSWTVTNEAAFYLALPLVMLALAFVSGRLRTPAERAAALAVVLGLVVLGSLLVSLSKPTSLGGLIGPAPLAYAFVPGVALAMLEHWLPQRVAGRRRWGWIAVALVGVGLVATFVFANATAGGQLVSVHGVLTRPLGTLFSSLVLYGCVIAQWAGSSRWRVLDNRPFRYLGERSYSIYLVHLGVILLISNALGPTQHAWHRAAFFVPLTLGVSIVVGELLYRTVERPAMRFGRGGGIGPRHPLPSGAPRSGPLPARRGRALR